MKHYPGSHLQLAADRHLPPGGRGAGARRPLLHLQGAEAAEPHCLPSHRTAGD